MTLKEWLGVKPWFFRAAPTGHMAPCDQMNLIMTREEWKDVKSAVDRFYDAVPDEEIEQHNKEIVGGL